MPSLPVLIPAVKFMSSSTTSIGSSRSSVASRLGVGSVSTRAK